MLITDNKGKEITEASFHHLSAKQAFDRKALQCSSQFANFLSEADTLRFWTRYQSLLHNTNYPIGNIKLFHLGYFNYRMPLSIPNALHTRRQLPAPHDTNEVTWALTSPCMMCNTAQNTLQHLYTECNISLQIWTHLLPTVPRPNWDNFLFNLQFNPNQLYNIHTYLMITYQLIQDCQRLHVQNEFYTTSNWIHSWLQTTFKSFYFQFVSRI